MINDIIHNSEHIFYFNQPSTIFNENFEFDDDKITNLKQYSLVIADFSSEHYGQEIIDSVHKYLTACQINFILLSHNIEDHLRYNNLFFYPHWYHWARKTFNQNCINNVACLEKTYPASCLNAQPRFHRIYNFLTIRKKSYFQELLFSMHQTNDAPVRTDDYVLPKDIADEWNQIKHTLGTRENLTINNRVSADAVHPAYTDSYINLVTEVTVLPKIFVSEKTWKPVANGQLFLVIGNPGIIDYLRHQGVDTFDDIIDHKYYDSELNWESRILKVHTVLESLLAQDLYKINEITQTRRLDNAKKFFAGEFDKQYSRDITTCINMPN